MNCQPKDAGHKIILDKIKRYDSQLESKIKEHLYIITHHTIPDLGEPTTVEHLRKKFVADIGVYFLMFFYNMYGSMECDRLVTLHTVGSSSRGV